VVIETNTRVAFISDRSTTGWVIAIEGANARVFVGGTIMIVPVDDLQATSSYSPMSLEDFKVAMTKRRLDHPLTEQFLSFRASKTDLYHHQFIPVKKMLESPEQKLLIADEVGIGKTIEAGLIWAELEARAPAGLENVWVICPKSLVGKWQEEMLQRFDLRLEQLTSDSIRQALVSLDRDGVLPPRFAQAVVNLELIRSEEHVEKLIGSAVTWDLAIFDEAHHLKNPKTLSHALASFISERSRAVLFLTATPYQTGLEDVVHLMQALGVDISSDPVLLLNQIEWDMDLNSLVKSARNRAPGWNDHLEEKLAKLESRGGAHRPGWIDLKQRLIEFDPQDGHQRAALIRASQDVQVLSPYMTRSRRVDIDADRPTRRALTQTVDFNPMELAFYDRVYDLCLLRADELNAPAGFITQMPERRTSSCAPAVAAEVLNLATEQEDPEFEARFSPYEVAALKPLAQKVIGTEDSKFDALIEMLNSLFQEFGVDRAMVFSTFRGTIAYLADRLGKLGFDLEVMHGGVPARQEDARRGEKTRESIAKAFRNGEFKILLASEVAGEGLDFEHCHVVINYDLPWNPMKVEQRIGRVDRIGQKSCEIYVGSLASRLTIEERILSRLYMRLNIFEQALGDLEAILGEQVSTFERDVFTGRISAAEQQQQLDRAAEAIATHQRTQVEIAESSPLFLTDGQRLSEDQGDISKSELNFLPPSEVRTFVSSEINSEYSGAIRGRTGADSFEIRSSDEILHSLRTLAASYPSSHFARSSIVRFTRRLELETKLKIQFQGQETEGDYIHVRHPLVLLARWISKAHTSGLPVSVAKWPDGRTDRKLIVWAVGTSEGYVSRVGLYCAEVDVDSREVISNEPDETNQLLEKLLGDSSNLELDLEELASVVESGEKYLLELFQKDGLEFQFRNEQLTDKAVMAVRSYPERKLPWLRGQADRREYPASIQNMYRGWADNLEKEAEANLKKLEAKRNVMSSLELIGAVLVEP
jgi:superfamily II DNA or RNA helicase